jgi:hypothetical protein
MGLKIWDFLRYFSEDDSWGFANSMDYIYLLMLDELRHRVGHPFYIHCAADREGHSDSSSHYQRPCLVSDFHISGVSIIKAYEALEKAGKDMGILDEIGLGIYPQWNSPGFHLDIRGKRGRWGCIDGQYVAFEIALKWAYNNL